MRIFTQINMPFYTKKYASGLYTGEPVRYRVRILAHTYCLVSTDFLDAIHRFIYNPCHSLHCIVLGLRSFLHICDGQNCDMYIPYGVGTPQKYDEIDEINDLGDNKIS